MKNSLGKLLIRCGFIFVIGSLISSCNNVKRTSKGKPLVQRTPGTLVKKNEKSNFNYTLRDRPALLANLGLHAKRHKTWSEVCNGIRS